MSAMEVEASEAAEGGGDSGSDETFRAAEMRMAAVFHPSVNPAVDPPTIESMDFHDDGRWMVTADSANEIMLIDTVGGKVEKRSHSKANPVGLVRYTHHEQSVLCSSHASVPNSDTAHDVRYLSLYDNTYLRMFHGHTEEVVSMAMCPADDTFVTGSKDRSVRLWNLNSRRSHGILQFPLSSGAPLVAYDPTGKVFASTYQSGNVNHVKLFDARNCGTGPFETFPLGHTDVAQFLTAHMGTILASEQIEELARAKWTGMQFSPDGNEIIISTDAGILLMIDAFEGGLVKVFGGHGKDDIDTKGERPSFQACFTPDGKSVMSGSLDADVCIWDTTTGEDHTKDWQPAKRLGGHVGPVKCVAVSPKYELFASGCHNVALWTVGGASS